MRDFIVLACHLVLVFFIPGPEIVVGNVSEMTCFVSCGMKNLNSINSGAKRLKICRDLMDGGTSFHTRVCVS